jgi:hypothetical protein
MAAGRPKRAIRPMEAAARMAKQSNDPGEAPACPVPAAPDLSGVMVAALHPEPPAADHEAALRLAEREARARLGEAMLLSWYDRDRDFEAPQHVSECHQDSAVPGYVDYALHRGAALKIDIEDGRFVFFYMKVDL